MHKHSGKFYLRVPAYPISKINMAADNLLVFVQQASRDEYFMKAILIASPVLHTEVLKIKNTESLDKNSRKIAYTLLKYWLRICHRSTPYGLFSGCTLGTIDTDNNILLDNVTNNVPYTRLDSTAIMGIKQALLLNQNIRNQIRYFPNNTLYKFGQNYRYVEQITSSKDWKYSISEFITNPEIEDFLKTASEGLSIPHMVKIFSEAGHSVSDASEFIDELIKGNILISDLEISIAGGDPLSIIIEKIGALKGVEEILSDIQTVKSLTKDNTFTADVTKEIQRLLAKIGSDRNFDSDTLLQIDLNVQPVSCQLDKAIIDDIIRKTTSLFPLTPHYRSRRLEDFKASFRNRYESKEVSLDIVMDPDIGLGYDGIYDDPLMVNQDDFLPQHDLQKKDASEFRLEKFQIAKLLEFYDKKYDHIEISDDDLKTLAAGRTIVMAESMFIRGSLLKKTGGDRKSVV